jgi:hypothetical protein
VFIYSKYALCYSAYLSKANLYMNREDKSRNSDHGLLARDAVQPVSIFGVAERFFYPLRCCYSAPQNTLSGIEPGLFDEVNMQVAAQLWYYLRQFIVIIRNLVKFTPQSIHSIRFTSQGRHNFKLFNLKNTLFQTTTLWCFISC